MGMSMGMFMGMSGSTTPKHCRIRGRTYYGRLAIPISVRTAYDGRQVLEQSLQTHDYEEAMARLGPWLQKCRAEFAKARAASEQPKTDMALVPSVELERLKQVRRRSTYTQLKNSPVRAKKQVGQKLTSPEAGPDYIEEAVKVARAKGWTYSDPAELLDVTLALHDADEMALELYRDGHEPPEAEDDMESPELPDHLETWLSEQYTNGKTRAEYKSIILGLNRWLEEQSASTCVSSISRAAAGSYVSYKSFLYQVELKSTS